MDPSTAGAVHRPLPPAGGRVHVPPGPISALYCHQLTPQTFIPTFIPTGSYGPAGANGELAKLPPKRRRDGRTAGCRQPPPRRQVAPQEAAPAPGQVTEG